MSQPPRSVLSGPPAVPPAVPPAAGQILHHYTVPTCLRDGVCLEAKPLKVGQAAEHAHPHVAVPPLLLCGPHVPLHVWVGVAALLGMQAERRELGEGGEGGGKVGQVA